MNVFRFDTEGFVFFINCYTANAGGEFAHHHDDLLSYVVFDKTKELLIDIGRLNYDEKSPWVDKKNHNGLNAESFHLRPCARAFMPRKWYLGAIQLNIANIESGVQLTAKNKYTNAEKVLVIRRGNTNVVEVEEKLSMEDSIGRAMFVHIYPDAELDRCNSKIRIADVSVEYNKGFDISMIERATAYGVKKRAQRVAVELAQNESERFCWTLTRVS